MSRLKDCVHGTYEVAFKGVHSTYKNITTHITLQCTCAVEYSILFIPANLSLMRSNGCVTSVEATPPAKPAAKCWYLKPESRDFKPEEADSD